MKEICEDLPFNNPEEMEMRERSPRNYLWDENSITFMIRPEIAPSLTRFLEIQPFFFIATADEHDHCDASFRGTEPAPDTSQMLPVCKVLNPKTLVFPDYSGNGLYNSLGNILRNPHIGMVFVVFSRLSRARINGRASIKALSSEILHI